MIYSISSQNPLVWNMPRLHKHGKKPSLPPNLRPIIITCFRNHNNPNSNSAVDNRPTFTANTVTRHVFFKEKKYEENEREVVGSSNCNRQMMLLCGFGYWVQGFRCFPWLALNFHMASNLNLHPSTLQLVQNLANLPMVAKPLYGILSDAIYIKGAHRIPYVVIGGMKYLSLCSVLCFMLFG